MGYRHTQKAPLFLLPLAVASLMLALSVAHLQAGAEAIVVGCVAVLLVVLAFSFRSLTIYDEGHRLVVRYGPLPIFGTSIDYRDISSFSTGRSTWIDGWGIHWIPLRGWTFNLWGFQCVEFQLGNRKLRIGTDDAVGLIEFLKQRLSLPAG